MPTNHAAIRSTKHSTIISAIYTTVFSALYSTNYPTHDSAVDAAFFATLVWSYSSANRTADFSTFRTAHYSTFDATKYSTDISAHK